MRRRPQRISTFSGQTVQLTHPGRFLALADPKKQRQAFKATLDADFILSA
jgi:hypothetical protein